MNCPKCQAAMEKVTFQDLEVDRCTACQGLWFAALVLERLQARKGSDVIDTGDPEVGAAHNAEGKIDCPVCHVRMVPMVDARQPHIWYEKCALCGGAFLDAGEFRDLKHHDRLDFFRDLLTPERE
jgi:uncharacterized protein